MNLIQFEGLTNLEAVVWPGGFARWLKQKGVTTNITSESKGYQNLTVNQAIVVKVLPNRKVDIVP